MRLNPFSGAFGKRRAEKDEEQRHQIDTSSAVRALSEEGPTPTNDPMEALRDIKRFGFAKRPDGSLIKTSDLDGWQDNGPEEKTSPGDHVKRHWETSTTQARALIPVPDHDPVTDQPDGTFRLARRLRPSSRREVNSAASDNASPKRLVEAEALLAQSRVDSQPLEQTNLSPLPLPSPSDDRHAPDDEAQQDGPLKRTAHTERLRAELEEDDSTTSAAPPTTSSSLDTSDGWKATPKPNGANLKSSLLHPEVPAIAPPNAIDVDPVTQTPDRTVGVTDSQNAHQRENEHGMDVVDGFDDVAVTIGRVVSIRGSVVWGALFDGTGGEASKAARMGTLVSMLGPRSRVFGIVNSLQREQQAGATLSERTVFEIQVLGEIADSEDGFQRGVSSYPPLDAPITTVTQQDIATIYARPKTSNVHIGQLRHNPKVPAFALTDNLLGKHFAVLGTTGSGKSCAVTVILQSILKQHPLGHIVLLDPHNEYGPAFHDHAELLNPGNLQLPYWLLNFEEISHILLGDTSKDYQDAQSALLKDAIIHAKRLFAGDTDGDSQITVDTPVPYRLSDLVTKLKDGMGMLNKADGASRYLGLINKIENLRADKRYAFMFQSLTVKDNMEQILAQMLRIPTKGKPLTIIDISGLPSEIVDVVVSTLFRLTFELAVWSERGKAPPVLLVCEEAHRYVPEEAGVGFAPTKRVISRIAKEGRKYGVTLCLVSQRPSELALNSLAQCNTVFALRLSNEHDQAFVGRALSENSRWLVDSLPSLNTQEAVVVGDGVTVPVHIRFNDLDADRRPASHNPSFSESWQQETDDAFLLRAIDRWRRQSR
ncbi:MAG: ATP-binding protein [Geminicoccales bacterium]